MSVYWVITLVVAVSRTQYIVKRAYARKNPIPASGCGRFAWLQVVTLTTSWLSVINIFLLLIWPLTYGPRNDVVVALLGIQYLLYNITAERYQTKLIRLGARIIPGSGRSKVTSPTSVAGKSLVNESEDLQDNGGGGNTFDQLSYLKNFDAVLTLLMTAIRAMTLIQFVLITVLGLALDPVTARRCFLAGIGMLGGIVSASWVVVMYQYQRCKNAIAATQKQVQEMMAEPGERPLYDSVLRKFTLHQVFLSLIGASVVLIHILWAVEVIPVTYVLVLVCLFFDTVTGVIMSGSFVFKFGRRRGKTSKKLADAKADQQSKDNQALATTAVPGGGNGGDSSTVKAGTASGANQSVSGGG